MPATEACHTSLGAFVDTKVLRNTVTDGILSRIMPHFPRSARVISGYLRPEDLYWKVNYHWEVLLEAIEHCTTLEIDDKHKATLATLKSSLLGNKPSPDKGYRNSRKVGEPKDRSPNARIMARHALLSKCKREFKAVVTAADVYPKTKRPKKALQLAFAPVAKPTLGKHSTGYALDIAGDNAAIKRTAERLGASTTFDEGSHVHCEWRNGVRAPAGDH